MQNKYIFLLYLSLAQIACQKSLSDFDPSQQLPPNAVSPSSYGGLNATIDGQAIRFTVLSATLTSYTLTNEKRVEIAALSIDNAKKIVFTLGETSAQGTGISAKKYTLNAYPTDDPATPGMDESKQIQGYTTYLTSTGSNWMFPSYSENGSFTVTNCDTSKMLISANFQTTLKTLAAVIKISAGTILNAKYRILK